MSAELVLDTERVKLWHGDAAEVLAGYKTESFDLVLTDPPYNVNWKSGMRSAETAFDVLDGDGDSEVEVEAIGEILRECVRLVGQNRHLYVFYPEEPLLSRGFKVSAPAELIWQKGKEPSMGDLSQPWGKNEERIWFYTSLFRHAGKKGTSNNPVRLRKGTILSVNKPKGKTVRHPSEKPLRLLQELIESSSRPGEIILDPFAGTGSTGVQAVLSGRRVVLCETDSRWVDLAASRLVEAEKIADQLSSL